MSSQDQNMSAEELMQMAVQKMAEDGQDVEEVMDSDMLLYWESDIGENIGNSAEAGIAHAFKMPIIMYSDTGHPHPFIAGMSKRILVDYEELVKYLNNIKFKDTSVADNILFNHGGKDDK